MFNLQTERYDDHGRGHEANVVSARGVLVTTLALAVLLVAVLLAMRVLFGVLAVETAPHQDYWTPQATTAPNPDQPAQLHELRAAEERLLNDYSWVDEKSGVARVPIERAMKILLQEGLPARQSSEETP